MILQRIKAHIKQKDPQGVWLKHSLRLTLASTIGMFFWHLVQEPCAFWTIMAAGLLIDSASGPTLRTRQLTMLGAGFLLAALIFITALLSHTLWLILPWIFVTVFLLLMIPYGQPQRHLAGIYLAILTLLALKYPPGLTSAIENSLSVLLGLMIAYMVNFHVWPDRDNHPWAPPCRNKPVVLRALRVALATVAAIIISYLLALDNITWPALTVIIVSQASLGASIRKSIHRLSGTLLGVLFGIIVAKYFLVGWPWLKYTAPLLVFFAWYPMLFFYTISAFFITLLVIDAYYFLPLHSATVLQYILSRLLDTGVGIAVALVAEVFLFAESARPQLRRNALLFWQQLEKILQVTQQAFQTGQPVEAWQKHQYSEQLTQYQQNAYNAFTDLTFEPYRFSPRYKKSVRYVVEQAALAQAVCQLLYASWEHYHALLPITQARLDALWENMEKGVRLLSNPQKPIDCRDPKAGVFVDGLRDAAEQLGVDIAALQDSEDNVLLTFILAVAESLRRLLIVYDALFTMPVWRRFFRQRAVTAQRQKEGR